MIFPLLLSFLGMTKLRWNPAPISPYQNAQFSSYYPYKKFTWYTNESQLLVCQYEHKPQINNPQTEIYEFDIFLTTMANNSYHF